MFNSLEDAIALARIIVERAQRTLEGCVTSDCDFAPAYFLFTERGVFPFFMEWDDDAAKDRAACKMRGLALSFRSLGLRGLLLITDCRSWYFDAKVLAQKLGVQPEQLNEIAEKDPESIKRHSRRAECLLCHLETYFGDWNLSIDYDRLEDGRVSWHPPTDIDGGSLEAVQGRFVDLLPPPDSKPGSPVN